MIVRVSAVWTFLKAGEIIADIGAGSGYFIVRLAPRWSVWQMESHGFRIITELAFLPYQYFLVFEAAR